jgi:N-acetylmuramoyl-L-alanine amidase
MIWRNHLQALYRLLDETRRARSLLNSNAAPALLFEQLFVSLARELTALNSARRRA